MCYADFAATFISTKAPVKTKRDDVRSYIRPAGATHHDYESDDDDDDDDDDDVTKSQSRNITLKIGLDKMRKLA